MGKKKVDKENMAPELQDRLDAAGRRRLQLNSRERADLLKKQMAQRVAAMYLDLNEKKSLGQMAEEVGVSVHTLKEITKSKEFEAAYAAQFHEIGNDPRYKAAQAEAVSLLPVAMSKLGSLLTSPDTPPTVVLKAVQEVFGLNKLESADNAVYSRQELVTLLTSAGVPEESDKPVMVEPEEDYIDAMAKYIPSDIGKPDTKEGAEKAGSEGIEPPPSVLETDVLPLN